MKEEKQSIFSTFFKAKLALSSNHFKAHHGNHLMGLLLDFDVCNTFVVVFITCELGQRLANAFSEINELIEEFQWYRFSILSQKPVSLGCFGSFLCGREAYKIVCWTEFICHHISHSYSITFHSFSSGFAKCLFTLYGASEIHQMK